ncbi:hypothetical protein GCM10007383_12550 [Arenibacter certesii]|uniref:Uncharacterized protein n=1 Tax=Arenibacter certesii TaxID=228955 RepID=A0A918ISF1_9FLAO|nr:hypothetical protein GCM10007383_12550 [Arenibacter certesii]
MEAYPVKFRWEGEDHMEIGHVQQFRFPCPDPFLSFMPLALGTMAVPTTIVTKVEPMAGRIVTAVNMASQGSSAAFAQGVQGS